MDPITDAGDHKKRQRRRRDDKGSESEDQSS